MIQRSHAATPVSAPSLLSKFSASRIREFLFAAVVGFLSVVPSCVAAETSSIAGRWITFDDDTKQKNAIVEIVQDERRATGRIAELFQQPGEEPDPICDRCPGTDRGRHIRGLAILTLEGDAGGTGFRGFVLDPEEGRTYRCLVTLQAGGKRLLLRSYLNVLGIEIFGREATWIRAE